MMKKYWRHAALAVQETLAYRISYVLNMVSTVITYAVIFVIWSSVYEGTASVGDFTWAEMKSYLLVSLFLSALVSMSSEFRVSRQIRTGNIAVELLRPVDYQKASLSITLGNSVSEGALVGIACLAFALVVGATVKPESAGQWAAFASASFVSVAVKFLLVYVFSLTCFWTTSLMGISWMRKALTDFFSGALIPISLFPEWLKGATEWLPFRSIVWVPATAFTGRLSGTTLFRELGVGAAWIVVLWFLGRLVWSRAMRKITVQGG